MTEYFNFWTRQIVNLSLIATSLGEDELLRRWFYRIHCAMTVPLFAFISFKICGIVVMISSKQFSLIEILIRIQYILLFSLVLYIVVAFIYNRPLIQTCTKHAFETLHSSSWVDEAPMWQKHTKELTCFSLIGLVTMLLAGVITTVISPVVRFKFMTGTTFVVVPAWYPVDVFASLQWFLVAYVWETVLFWYFVWIVWNTGTVFLYGMITTKVRLIVLGVYLKVAVKPDAPTRLREEDFVKTETKGPVAETTKNSLVKTNKIGSHSSYQRFKAGIIDLSILRRQMMLLNQACGIFATPVHFSTMVTNALALFVVANELRNSGKPTVNMILFLSLFFASFLGMFLVCYISTMLQEAYKNLRYSLMENEWYTGDKDFNKLFLLFEMILDRPSKLKAYSFYPINLRTFTLTLQYSRSVFLFLYQVSAKK